MTAGSEAKTTRQSRWRSVQDVLREESERQDVPEILLTASPYDSSDVTDLPVERYISREYHEAEVEKVWRRTWQVACRVDDIPNVGDIHVYDIVNDSIIVVRSDEDTIRAYYNACLHRGTTLKVDNGNVPCIRCPFHGWTWNLDGSLARLPSEWDLRHVTPDELALPQVHVGTWDGWVFINMSEDPEPLSTYLGPAVEHFKHFSLENRFVAMHLLARYPCNWKVALEAFIESYHVWVTHPEIAPFSADESTQYDVLSEHISRMLTLEAQPSTQLSDYIDDRTAAAAMISAYKMADLSILDQDGKTGRDVVAELVAGGIEMMHGAAPSNTSNTMMLDALEYLVFPNLVPWGGFGTPFVYRFRPDGDNHEASIMDIMITAPVPPGAPRPSNAEIHVVEDGDDWTAIPNIGLLGQVFAQDAANLRRIQKGLKTTRKPGVTLASYQESRIRHHADTLQRYLDAD